MRTCIDCGTPEVRQANGDVNLEPVSGRCVDCLAQWARASWRVALASVEAELPADYKLAQAGDRDEGGR